MNTELFCRSISFLLNDGTEIHPVMIKARATGNVAFVVSPGGKGGNTRSAAEEVDESTIIRKVMQEGYAVRCASLDRVVNGLYKVGHRAVREVRQAPLARL